MGNVPPSTLCNTPPPHGRSNMVHAPATSEAKSRVRTRVYYSRRCKKVISTNIESLPDELLKEILLRLSADEIYDNARLVCRHWRHQIHSDAFVQTHLRLTSSGLLLSDTYSVKSSPVFVTATTQGRVETSRLSCRIGFPILCSCNGLALCLRRGWYRGKGELTPFIFNPATKSAFYLPWFHVVMVDTLGIAYATASMAYKVVGSYVNSDGVEQCGIFTVGVDDAWRDVANEGLSPQAINNTQSYSPLMTGGFLHWVSDTLVVSLNVETETFTLTPTPALMLYPQGRQKGCYPLSTGECLSLLIPHGDNWSWEVWEMKPETWEWRKVIPKINLEPHKRKIQQFSSRKDDGFLMPVGWVRYPNVLAFFFKNMSRSCIIYNLDTKEFKSIELPTAPNNHTVVQHRKSLVWLEQC